MRLSHIQSLFFEFSKFEVTFISSKYISILLHSCSHVIHKDGTHNSSRRDVKITIFFLNAQLLHEAC